MLILALKTQVRKKERTNDSHIRENWVDTTPMNLSKAMITRGYQFWVPTRISHEMMSDDTPHMNDPRSTHCQALQYEIAYIKV